MRNLQIDRLTPTIGAEIHGVDLSQALSDDEINAIRDALPEHLVVFFRDQSLDAPSLDQLGRRFGEPHPHYAAPEGVDGLEGITLIHADAHTPANNGSGWHSDNSFDEVPPMGSIMYLHTASDIGGYTMWANMYAAYDALSDSVKNFLGGLTARHDSGPPFRRLFSMTEDQIVGGTFNAATHPAVRTHPETGKKGFIHQPLLHDPCRGARTGGKRSSDEISRPSHRATAFSMSFSLVPQRGCVLGQSGHPASGAVGLLSGYPHRYSIHGCRHSP